MSCPDKHVQLHHHEDPGLQHGDRPGGLAPGLHAPGVPLAGGVRRHPQADCHLQTVSTHWCSTVYRAYRRTMDYGPIFFVCFLHKLRMV